MEPWNFGTLEPGTLKGWTWILELVNYTLSQEVLDGYGVLCCNMKQIKLRPFLFDHILKKRQWPPGEEGLMNIERSGICWFLGLILCFYFFWCVSLVVFKQGEDLEGWKNQVPHCQELPPQDYQGHPSSPPKGWEAQDLPHQGLHRGICGL